ncbi:hypothetical protein [Flavobacterium sp. GSB-24]|uniref:hypothetical protein n=1 Tax=Flavobacterium sp. GSB-24 TaxID=2994319 RepID=UPI0024933C6E|nr:hypothetical protein [Flavobacterium sp. GSB-24]BDU27675.1 hypothetical protein FLGSB24_44190 [Flavobacterium sp. GSB-24]
MKKIILVTLFNMAIFSVNAQNSQELEALKALDTLTEPTKSAPVKNEAEIGNAISIIKKITVLNGQYNSLLNNYEKNDQNDKLSQETMYMKHLLSEISSIYSKGVFFLKKDDMITSSEKENYEKIYNTTISESLDDFEFAIRIIKNDNIQMSNKKIIAVVEDLKNKQFQRRDTMSFYNEKISSDSDYKKLNLNVKQNNKN